MRNRTELPAITVEPDVLEPVLPGAEHQPLTLRVAIRRILVVAVVASLFLGAGAVNGVGPLAHVTPPDQVTDPDEMLTRSLQALIDASSVHLESSVSGHVPGALLGRPEARVALDGTHVSLDLRPQDARTQMHVSSPALGIQLESLSRWDALAFRTQGGEWRTGSLASVVGTTGIDANPLTLVERLSAWLAAPGAPRPVESEVACAAASGRCHQLRVEAGDAPGAVLLAAVPGGRGRGVGPTTTEILLLTDASTLQPAHLDMRVRTADGSVDIVLAVDASGWDAPSVIADPPGA